MMMMMMMSTVHAAQIHIKARKVALARRVQMQHKAMNRVKSQVLILILTATLKAIPRSRHSRKQEIAPGSQWHRSEARVVAASP